METNANPNIHEALGLKHEWVKHNNHRIIEFLMNEELVSDVMVKRSEEIKEEEFGEVDTKLSDYEKKLLWTGMEVAKMIKKGKVRGVPGSLCEIPRRIGSREGKKGP